MDIKDKRVTSNAKGQNTKRDFSTLRPAIHCYNCQDYGYVAANCPCPVKAVEVRKSPVINLEPHPSLLSTPVVIVYSGCQPLPSLLSTPSPLRVSFDKLNFINTDSDSKEFIYHAEEIEVFNSNKENMVGNIEESVLRVLSR